MLVYAGEFDQQDGPTTMMWMDKLLQFGYGGNNFFEQSRKIYYFYDDKSGFRVGGYYRYDPVKKFTFLTVPKSGHFVPHDYL